MMGFKVGDTVRLTGEHWEGQYGVPGVGEIVTLVGVDKDGDPYFFDDEGERWFVEGGGYEAELVKAHLPIPESTPVRPHHYLFPGDTWVSEISKYQTSNGGQALQYIARSTRLDGNNKGRTKEELIEDLEKSKVFIDWEIERLKEEV